MCPTRSILICPDALYGHWNRGGFRRIGGRHRFHPGPGARMGRADRSESPVVRDRGSVATSAVSRDFPEPSPLDRVRGRAKLAAGDLVRWGWDKVVELG